MSKITHDASPVSGSSSSRFRRYREELTRRQREKKHDARGRPKGAMHRSFPTLVRAYLGLLRPYRRPLALSFVTLVIATALALVPPAGIKIAIDCVFGNAPLPALLARFTPSWVNTGDRSALLAFVAGATLVTILLKVSVSLVGRSRATVVAKKLQVALRRRAFAKAVHLPLSRVHELKAGGVATLIREDAGAAGELLAMGAQDAFGCKAGSALFRSGSQAWSVSVKAPRQVRALALTGSHLLSASAKAGDAPGGILTLSNTEDGATVTEVELPAPPVFDGLAAAHERVYISLANGTLLSMGRPD